jgi:ketosteroid isomerase-like protein
MQQTISTYVAGWQEGNREKILSCLDPACVIIEAHGSTFRGKDMVARWVDSWFHEGNIVNSWKILDLHEADDSCFFEWIFECTHEGKVAALEGASLARFRDGAIISMREYATVAPRHEWDG